MFEREMVVLYSRRSKGVISIPSHGGEHFLLCWHLVSGRRLCKVQRAASEGNILRRFLGLDDFYQRRTKLQYVSHDTTLMRKEGKTRSARFTDRL